MAWCNTVAVCCYILLVVHPNNIEVVEPLCNFTELVLVFLIVKRSPNRFDGLVALSSAILRHQNGLVRILHLHVI